MTFPLLAWFIRYPDRIKGKLIITSANPPIGVDGYIMDLPVKDRNTVEEGELLAIIQNPAHYEDVVQLQQALQSLRGKNLNAIVLDSIIFPPLQLGSMQEHYTNLQTAWSAYRQYLRLSPHYQESLSVDRQLAQYQRLSVQKQAEKELFDRKAKLVENDFLRNEQLYASQFIAEKSLEISEQAWLEAKYTAESVSSTLSHIQLEISQLENKQQQLDFQHIQTINELHSNFQSAMDNLRATLSQWEEQYVLKAPQAGSVSFFYFESSKQYLRAQDTVMSIIPQNDQPVLGRLLVPVQNFGKVKIGQKVRVYLNNYPHEEYGTLTARVEGFSDLPHQRYYRVIISFPEGLKTQYGHQSNICRAGLRLLRKNVGCWSVYLMY